MKLHRSAFTLIELLIAVALGVGLITIAWAGFQQTLKGAKRSQAVVTLHQSARYLYETLGRDLGSTQNVGAAYLLAEPPDSSHGGRLSFVVLSSQINPDRYSNYSEEKDRAGDLRWVMLRWTRNLPGTDPGSGASLDRLGTLALARSSPTPRVMTVEGGKRLTGFTGQSLYWSPGGFASSLNSGLYLPNPVRTLVDLDPDTGYPRLNAAKADWQIDRDRGFAGATWGMKVSTSDPGSSWTATPATIAPTWVDYGDWQDLLDNLEPVSAQVSALKLTIVDTDGSTTESDPVNLSGSAVEAFWEGIPVDGKPGFHLAPPGIPGVSADKILATVAVHDKRPARLHLELTLTDRDKAISVPLFLTLPLSAIQP